MAAWELKYGSQFTKQTEVKYELLWLLKYEWLQIKASLKRWGLRYINKENSIPRSSNSLKYICTEYWG